MSDKYRNMRFYLIVLSIIIAVVAISFIENYLNYGKFHLNTRNQSIIESFSQQ